MEKHTCFLKILSGLILRYFQKVFMKEENNVKRDNSIESYMYMYLPYAQQSDDNVR